MSGHERKGISFGVIQQKTLIQNVMEGGCYRFLDCQCKSVLFLETTHYGYGGFTSAFYGQLCFGEDATIDIVCNGGSLLEDGGSCDEFVAPVLITKVGVQQVTCMVQCQCPTTYILVESNVMHWEPKHTVLFEKL